jgi:hypothetical protein
MKSSTTDDTPETEDRSARDQGPRANRTSAAQQ